MKESISFVNPGVIDPRVYALFGVSVKMGETPIGYFGTGLKYAIAVWLRLGCRVELYRGLERTEFTTHEIDLRGQKFQGIKANALELPFTTELGKNWAAWQAMRELWCNAIDEKGEMQYGRQMQKEGVTTIVVTGDAAAEAYAQRDTVMLRGAPDWNSAGVHIHEREASHVYYRGIRVHDLRAKSLFTYNIVGTSVTLTEDRTAKYDWLLQHQIGLAIVGMTDEAAIYAALTAKHDYFEWSIPLHEMAPCAVSPEFLSVVEKRLASCAHGNPHARELFMKCRGTMIEPEAFELSAVERTMFARAKTFCAAMGLHEVKGPALKIRFASSLDSGVLGKYTKKTDTIYIAREAFQQGTKLLAGTLFEELLHARRDLADESRALQNYLINALVSEYEERMGSPL